MDRQSGKLFESEFLKWIKDNHGNLLALWISSDFRPETTVFLTPDNFLQQLGFIFREKGGEIEPHFHAPIKRELIGTSEFLLLKKGRVSVDLYDDSREFVANLIMEKDDLILLISGGHGFAFIEEGFFLEVKQGPYFGLKEKVRLEE